ncbi:MAG: hypothetical protein JXA37_12045 [Chloroflexia bacterium]|nr:hypothetical protein [Chloroflexia bacterium]
MTEIPPQDINVRTHLFGNGEQARGAIFVGGVGSFRFEGRRASELGWQVSFLSQGVPQGLEEALLSAVLSSISVAEGLHRHPPPRILSVEIDDLRNESIEPQVDVRDVFVEAGIAQGFVSVPGKGRFTFQADRRPEGEWNILFGLDFALPEKVAARLERLVLPRIEEAMDL